MRRLFAGSGLKYPAAMTACAVALGCTVSPAMATAWTFLTAAAMVALACLWVRSERGRDRDRSISGDQLTPVYRSAVEALVSAIAAKDSYTPWHIRRRQLICCLMAEKLGLAPDITEGVRIAALVQDVGKLGVPDYILLKPGPLDPEEFSKVSNHAAIGAKVLERVSFPWSIADMVRHHHEKYDGTGYPDRLVGDRIPLGSRIIAIAEVYEALVSKRCYKDCWSHHQAVEHIAKLAGTHFDPRIVDAFLAVEPDIAALGTPPELAEDSQGSQEHDLAAEEVIAQANRELVSLFEIAQTLSSTLEIDEVLALLAHRNRRLLQAATCAVFLVDDIHPKSLVARVAVGRHQELFKGARATLGRGVTGKAASRQRAYVGNFDPNDLALAGEGHVVLDLKSCAVAPIISLGEVLGAICLYDTSPHAFSVEDLRLLTMVAHQAALAIKNASTFERVRDSAMRDPLTGLHNARFLRVALDQEMNRAGRQGEPVSVLGVDLDNFKSVNDHYGHLMGDRVLTDVAAVLRAQLRDYDLISRTGGDEFVVVLPGTPEHEALATADRVRLAIDRYAEQSLAQKSVRLGASVGVATYPADAEDMETLLERADAAMYRDKRERKQSQLAA